MLKANQQEIDQALCLIFDTSPAHFHANRLVLDEQVLKNQFRKKAKSVHPDRAASIGASPALLNEQFKRINQAYQYLLTVIKNHDRLFEQYCANKPAAPRPVRKQPPQSRANTAKKKTGPGQEFMPKQYLKFAQFLFHKDIITWNTVLDALAWQSTRRPRLGEIGRGWKYFDSEEISLIIKKKKPVELFGKAAIRLGYINQYKLWALLGRQRSYNVPVGRYFVEQGILDQTQIEHLMTECRKHNRQFPDMFFS